MACDPGAVKQNTWLNGNTVFGSLQMDEVADPIILAWQLGATSGADWGYVEELANYLVSNGPYTPQDRWEENSGYSPATMAAEIAGLICAASIAEANGNSSLTATYQSTAQSWASEVDNLTYTTTGSYGNGDYFLRITPDGSPNRHHPVLQVRPGRELVQCGGDGGLRLRQQPVDDG